mmetsp:Transcript_17705/g.40053  ORF Transcript_17705/g.40053 Transcript_17705/m.40053 type:complete len:408 (+) Transcript_17705:260-1483(+)
MRSTAFTPHALQSKTSELSARPQRLLVALLELRIQGEEHVERLCDVAVDWDVEDGTDYARVGDCVDIEICRRQLNACEFLFHLGAPHLHEGLDVRHRLGVVDVGRRVAPVQLGDALYPVGHLLRMLRRVVDVRDRGGLKRGLGGDCSELQVQHGRICLLCRGLVEHCEAESILLAIRTWDLEEGVNLSDGWDVLRDEGLQLGFQLDGLRLVSSDVLEQLSDFIADLKVGIVHGVVSLHLAILLLLLVIFRGGVRVLLVVLPRGRSNLHLLLPWLGRRHMSLLDLACLLHSLGRTIILLDRLRAAHIDCLIKVLVLNDLRLPLAGARVVSGLELIAEHQALFASLSLHGLIVIVFGGLRSSSCIRHRLVIRDFYLLVVRSVLDFGHALVGEELGGTSETSKTDDPIEC